MNNLITFDPKGVFGPATALIYKSAAIDEDEISMLANTTKENFTNLAHLKLKGKKEFCAFIHQKKQNHVLIHPTEIMATTFFQNMRKKELSLQHEKVLSNIVPGILKIIQEQIPQVNLEHEDTKQLKEWVACVVETYMTDDQIKEYCELKLSEVVINERKKLGMELSLLCTNKRFTENDLEILINICRTSVNGLQKSDHFISALELFGKFLIFVTNGKENAMGVSQLSKEDYLAFISENQSAIKQPIENDAGVFENVIKTALKDLEEADHIFAVLNLAGRYMILFSKHEENPMMLCNNVLDLLSTIFKYKMFPSKKEDR